MLAASTFNTWWAALSAAPLTGAAIALIITGTMKAARPLRTVPTLRALNLPASPLLVVVLGVVEVVVGILATGGFILAMIATGVLYAGFAVVVHRLRHLPDPISCGCLGSETGRPGTDHLIMNWLVVLAALVAVRSPYRYYWILATAEGYSHVALALVVAVLMLAVIAGAFRFHQHPPRVETKALTAPTPCLVGVHPDGQPAEVSIGAQPTVLAFFASNCVTCASMWPDAAKARLGPHCRLVVVAHDPGHERPARVAELHPDEVTIVMSTQAWLDYGVTSGPVFVVTGVDKPYAFTAADWPSVRATAKAGRKV